MPPAFFLRPLGRRLWFRRFGCVTSPGVLRAHLSRIHLRATRTCACRQRICDRMGRSPAVRECFVSTQRTWPVPQPMQLVESVEILRFLLVSWCLRGVHVRCVDTGRRSSICRPLLATTATNPVKRSPGVVCKFERSRVAVPFAANYDLMLRCTENSCYGGVAELAVIVLRTHHRGRRLIPGPQPPCPQARSREKEAANRPASPDLPGHARREREQAQWDLCRAIR